MDTNDRPEDRQPDTLTALLRGASRRYGDKPCIRWMEQGKLRERSYGDLWRDSLAFSRWIGWALPPRAHIVLLGKTTYVYLTALNAVFMSGCVAVPLDPALPAEELFPLFADCDADAVFFDPDSVPDGGAFLSDADTRLHVFDLRGGAAFSVPGGDTPPDEMVTPERPADVSAILYTSGTTGTRKGAMLTSAALISNVCFREMSFEGENVALNVLPMHHIFSFSCDYLKNLKDGVTICLNSALSALGAELLIFEPTVIRVVPMILDSLLRRVRILRRRDPSLPPRAAAERVFGKRLVSVIVSGAAYAAAADAEFSEMGITVRQGYGMTETGPRIAVPDGNTCAASGGRIISICEVRLQNGEIQVKSPSLMKGYYKREKETREVFTEDGWFRTGDLGRITEDRELFITGRLKNVIILGNGENVSPEELEQKLRASPLILEAEVFEENGAIAADIYPDADYLKKHGLDAEPEIRAYVAELNANAPPARVIDRIFYRTEPLPKTATGKIKRRRFLT